MYHNLPVFPGLSTETNQVSLYFPTLTTATQHCLSLKLEVEHSAKNTAQFTCSLVLVKPDFSKIQAYDSFTPYSLTRNVLFQLSTVLTNFTDRSSELPLEVTELLNTIVTDIGSLRIYSIKLIPDLKPLLAKWSKEHPLVLPLIPGKRSALRTIQLTDNPVSIMDVVPPHNHNQYPYGPVYSTNLPKPAVTLDLDIL
jgi:hypothetical protein